jgi:hypothetical protein
MTRWPFLVRIRARNPEVLFLFREVPPKVRLVIVQVAPNVLIDKRKKATVYHRTTEFGSISRR